MKNEKLQTISLLSMLTFRRLAATALISFSFIHDLKSFTAKAAETPAEKQSLLNRSTFLDFNDYLPFPPSWGSTTQGYSLYPQAYPWTSLCHCLPLHSNFSTLPFASCVLLVKLNCFLMCKMTVTILTLDRVVVRIKIRHVK